MTPRASDEIARAARRERPPPLPDAPGEAAAGQAAAVGSARDGTCLKLEDVFAAMRETLRGAQECAHALEVKDEDIEDVRLPVDALGYTQNGCSQTFRCGTTLQKTVSDIVTGNVDPLQASWCKVQVASCKW